MNKRIIREDDGRYRLEALSRFGNWLIFGFFNSIKEANDYQIDINELY